MNSNNTDNKLDNTNVGRDYIGRDDNSLNLIKSGNLKSTYLDDLYERFEREKKENSEFKELCEELDYFNSIVEGDVIGLEEKLQQGGREKILFYALDVKDKFHRKLMKTSQYSLIAQDVNVYLLSKVRSSFMREIYSLICNDESEEKINLMITERIIRPVQEDLGINLFKYNEDDIMGMIFFLTGNCHLKWN
ncbi:ABC-three component system protein [Chryseobacterium bernardetii]|uniref:ABC-three component system protein n=1 Tax=Chryseobacterium bernardetii TaxID=1241978 RepID=UPI003016E118